MTSAEFLEKLNHQQQTAYVEGAIEMLAYGLDKPKASRVIDWYYKGDGPAQLVRALHQHRDLPVQGVLQVLAKRVC